MKLSDCKKHNWVFDEFNEQCPLCEAVDDFKYEFLNNLIGHIKRAPMNPVAPEISQKATVTIDVILDALGWVD
jgi:hypothetical protein